MADTTLFDDGLWRVIGVEAGAEPLPIAVTQRGTPLGSFSALRFSYALAAGFAPVLALFAGGALEPSLPPPGVPAPGAAGALLRLRRWPHASAGFVALDLPEKAKRGRFDLRGTLSNGDSLESEKLRIRLRAPKPDQVRVELRYRLVATRDFCVDRALQPATDEFRAVELVTQYPSPQQHLSDLTRYVKDVELDCDLDCDLEKVWFCAALANETGPVIDRRSGWRAGRLELLNTTSAPQPAPTLSVELRSPNASAFKPQGSSTASADPAARNVSFWADWVDVRHEYHVGQRVGNFRFALEARAPGSARLRPPAGLSRRRQGLAKD